MKEAVDRHWIGIREPPIASRPVKREIGNNEATVSRNKGC
jgi:hypothetical protein